MDMSFTSDPKVCELVGTQNQLSLSKKPQNYRFEIVVDGQAINSMKIWDAIGVASKANIFGFGVVDRVDLSINPTQYRLSEPTREGITQTISGAWVDFYGLGLPKITMSGTTGWNPLRSRAETSQWKGMLQAARQLRKDRIDTLLSKGPNPPKVETPTGLQDFIYLRNCIFRKYALLLQKLGLNRSKRVQEQVQLRFYAWDTEDYFIVLIDNFELVRNASRPMMYDYNLTMTVIGSVVNREQEADFIAAQTDAMSRVTGILTSLRAYQQGLAVWGKYINESSAFVSRILARITRVVDSVATAVEDVTKGIKSFVDVPFKATEEVLSDSRDLLQAISDLEQIPLNLRNEIRNQVVEMMCAVAALKTYPGIFKSQWNDLFDETPWQNIHCASTFNLSPGPADARPGVSAEPALISNSSGAIPGPSNFPRPAGTYGTQSNAVSEYRLRQVDIVEGDTVDSVIRKIGGLDGDIAQVWQQIAILNDLEYPYIAPNADFQTNYYATGSVVFTGTPSTSIPAGTIIGTSLEVDPTNIIAFSTVATVVIGADGKATANIISKKPGEFANVAPLSISVAINVIGEVITIAGVDKIENPSATTGGRIIKVLRPGQRLSIPVSPQNATHDGYVERSGNIEQDLFKADLYLNKDGDFDSDFAKDVSLISGIVNMGAAVIDRITTNRGELFKHPTYGVNMGRIIGEPGDKHHLDIMRLELMSSLQTDPRIKRIDNLTIAKSQDLASVDMNIVLIDETTRQTQAVLPI